MTPIRLVFALLPILAALGSPAAAQSVPPELAPLQGAPIRPGDAPGIWIVGDWRESEVALAPFGFRVSLTWNGLGDDRWPFERIVAALAAPRCAAVTPEIVRQRVAALYQRRSLVPERNLGGNAGVSFKKRLTVDLGECRAEFLAEGARWHRLGVVVYRP